MDYAVFDDKLLLTLNGRSRVIIVVIIFVAITLLFEVIYFCITKSNRGVSIWNLFMQKPLFATRLTTKQQIGRDITVLCILTFIFIFTSLPIFSDIANQQYVKIEAQYSRNDRTSDGNLFSYGHVYAETDKKTVTLELPYGWTEDEFPLGTYRGTVWYSEESKVILAFIPQ